MVRRETYEALGGLDEENLPVSYNDVDLCLKIGALGLRVLYTPYALLHHHEAFSKTSKDLIPRAEEVALMRTKWGHVIAADLVNPDFVALAESFGIRGVRVHEPDGLRSVLGDALAANEPALIEVTVGEMPSAWHLVGPGGGGYPVLWPS